MRISSISSYSTNRQSVKNTNNNYYTNKASVPFKGGYIGDVWLEDGESFFEDGNNYENLTPDPNEPPKYDSEDFFKNEKTKQIYLDDMRKRAPLEKYFEDLNKWHKEYKDPNNYPSPLISVVEDKKTTNQAYCFITDNLDSQKNLYKKASKHYKKTNNYTFRERWFDGEAEAKASNFATYCAYMQPLMKKYDFKLKLFLEADKDAAEDKLENKNIDQ